MKKEIINKNLKKQDKEKVMRFSIRKYSFGAASVAVATLLMFLGNGAVSADQLKISEESANKVELMQDGEKISTDQSNAKDSQPELDKSLLANYILEVETNITSGVYSTKTEESLANLSTELASAKASLNSALNQEELNRAYQKLVTAVNSKLRNKVVEKKEISEDTTNRQDTVTQKTENVEKETENSEKNTEPSQDDKTESTVLRKSSSVDSNTGFRAAVNEDPKVDFTFSIPSEKKIYIYNEENFTLEIPVYSESGKIRYATIKKGSRQKFNNVPDTENDLDIEYGFTATVINRAENPTLTTPATKKNPAKIVIKGRPNDVLKNNSGYTKREDQNLNIGTRYLQVVDDKGRENLKKGQDMSDPAYFYLVLKSQSKKYALRAQPADELITVSSLTNPTAEDREKIKNGIQIEYSTANEDARLVNKRGTLVENPDEIIQSIDVVGNNIVVTFTDGSTRTRPVGEVLRENIPPTVQVPYSNEQNRTIYVYSSEETDLTFTAKDESKIKDMKLRGAGDSTEGNLDAYGYTVGKITESALTSGEGSVSDDKKSASIKMTGITNAKPGQKWTSIIVANDYNNGESAPYNGRIEETTNVAERQKIAGYVEFVVKNQTSKYDIQAPESKVSVVDPNNITTEEFEKIKEKVKIEYSQTNDDANLISKSGKIVENQEARIDTIAKDSNGNLVVTYKDGSIDTRSLSEFITLNKQSAIDAINDAAESKIVEINSNLLATAEEKAEAIAKVNADKEKALTAIGDVNIRTKEALDFAKGEGLLAISKDNPITIKKAAAKAAIDDALKSKEAAIDLRTDLTDEEKAAAKADAKAKADEAKKNIDNATTNATVESAKTSGIIDIESVNPQAGQKKNEAKTSIEQALKAKEAEIDSRTDLTEEEKAIAKADAKAKADEAKKNIDAATTNAEVDQAKSTGTTEVNGVNPTAQSKPVAKQAIDEALKVKEAAIDSRTDLTDEEKAIAKADAKAKADEAKKNIDTATTDEAVSQAKTAGTTSIASVSPTAQSKPAAKQAIDEALKAKEAAIDSRTDLTDEEKAVARADAKAKADEAKKNIDNATTDEAVSQAKTAGTTSIASVNPTAQSKPAAKQAIDDALKTKEASIDSRTDLTDEEKTAAKADAKAKADTAKQAIDTATTTAEVDQAKSTGTTEVNGVNPTAQSKPAAKQAIDDALKTKEASIDSRTDLTDEEKTAAKADAKAKADTAKQAIDTATTTAEVDQAKSTGTTEVNGVNPTAQSKPAAKQAIDDALKTKEAAIDSRTDLTDEEKAAAKADAKAKADEAKRNIDTATTDEAVSQAKTAGTTEVNSVNPQAVSKPAAKQAIDDALKTKEASIDSRTDLTDEEKAVAKADAKAKSDEAKKNIDAATTNAEVDQAKSTGTTEVNSINPQPVAKPAAKQAIDEALKAKEAAIDSRTDLTDEEKAVARADAKAKADEAKKNIDNATTDEAVSQAKTAGTTSIASVNPTAQSKPAAKQAIDDALKTKEASIDSRTDLTDEEKTAAKADAKAKADTAKQAIDTATTTAEVDQAKSTGTTEVNGVNPTAQSKPAAKQAIDDALKTKETEIDSRTDLTDEEKTAAKADAKAKADTAKQAIDTATTTAEVDQAKSTGTTEVNGVNPAAQSKPAAKQAIDDALKTKESAIDSRTDLTDEEKAAAKADAKAKADEAKKNIDAATTDEAVSQAKTAGTTEVNGVNPAAQSKPAAKQSIDDALKAKEAAIDSRTDLTDEEKAVAKADAKAKADEAKKNIDAATTDAEVDQAKSTGTTEVNGVNPQPVAKPAAKQAIDDALKAKEAAIDSRTDLTDEEKAVAKADAKAKAEEAKKNIDAATTDEAVSQAKTAGTTEVNGVNPAAQSKPAAKQAIDDALKAKETEIDSRTDLTDEEKAAAKADAKVKAEEAKRNIDTATTDEAVSQAKTAGTTEVNAVNPTAQSKPTAKQAIDDALKAKETEIDSRTDLTDEEKTAAKADAKAKADEAKRNIDTATTDEAVSQAKTAGTTEVNSVNPQAVSKPAAKQAIDDALKTKEASIDSRTDLTGEEKAVAKADAKAKSDEAKKNIDAATTNAEVDQVKTDGITEVNGVNPQPVAKPVAKQAIEEALKAKEAEIDSRTDLTDEEKAAAKADAQAKSDEAKKNIDAATTNAEVDQAKSTGTTEVNAVNPQAVAKPAAKQAIDDALKTKEAAIDSRTDLTDEEKAAAKADAQAKADEAKKNIDAATTNAEVDQVKTDGITEVNGVNPQPVAKPVAKQAIEEALKAKEAAIDSRTDLTDEEKAIAKADAKAKADEAKKNIDTATTDEAVSQAKTDGITEVNGVELTAQSKPAAKQAIDEALKAKEAAIDSRTDLTDEEKAVAKADAKAKADEAKKNIDAATTDAEVDQAKSTGTTEVNSVNPQPVAKPAAKQAIEEALKAKEAEIDSRTDLTDEEKAAAKADAQAKSDEAKKNIDAATTNAEVDQAKSTGTTEVNSVNPQPVAKPAAKQAIDDALKTKESAIDSRTDLTDEEKAAAKADAKVKAEEAKRNIDTATTDEAVSQAKTAGTTEVNAVNPTAQSKPTAKQAIDDALKAKETEIDSRTDLTDEEKTAAKADAKAKADEAKRNIDTATTDEAVSQAKTAGTTEVNSVNPQAVSKPAAKQAIDDALKTKEASIDSRTDLTGEEKAVAKADAKAKSDEAKKNIDAATTNAEVDQVKTDGITEVNGVNPQPVAKPVAKQAIEEALKAKEAEIDSRTDLTDEEKAAAKADAQAKSDEAKKNIDAATTNAEVDQAKSTGTTEVNAVNPQAVAKPAAKQAIDDALKTKEAAIDSRTDLTDEEKAAAKADAQAKADEAKKNIDAATTNAEVDQVKTDGITEVNGVNPQPVAKPVAKQAIEEALKAKEAAIDSRTDLTDEEKAIAKADAKAKADEAKKNIDTATTDEAVSQAKTDGITEVNGVELTAQSKPAAKQAIDEALKAKEAAIDSRTDLTDEEKAVAKADAKAKADEAKKNIDAATTDAEVDQAKSTGTTEVNSVNPQPVAKPAAKQAIEEALKAKEAEIDSRTDLTDEEKAAAKADAQAKSDEAKKNIDAATTNAEVDQAKSTGTTEVNSVNPQPVAKPAAKQAIDDALKTKESAIDSRTDLTDEEKAAAKADAKAKADKAKKNIDNATTDEAVSQAKTDGINSIASVNPTAQSKPSAKQAIDDALKAKEAAIDSRTDLTDEEKAAAKADAKAKADEAKKNIDAATTDEAVSKAKTAGTTEITSINPQAVSKPAAKQAIDDALKTKEASIDSRTDLTGEEKAVAKADAKAKSDEAKKNIDAATTNAEVDQVKTDGITEVNGVNPQPVAKPVAKQAIEEALKAKEAEIDSRTDLTDEEKAAAKADAQAKSDEAKKNIDAATTNAEVDQAKSTGTTEVNAVNPQAVAKPAAKQAIDDALKTKEAAIDSRTDLTDEEKAAAKADAQAKADEAKKNIDAATTNAEVDQVKTDGITEVNGVNPQPVAKPVAKQAIEEALKAKEAAIDSRTDLTDEEKAIAKADAKAKADEAKKNIDTATTDEAVSQAKTDGITEVNGVELTAQSKPAAKQAIDEALKAKEAAIDSRTDLTDEEKAVAKADAKAKADEAKKNIDAATTDAEVDQAKSTGTTEVNSVNPQPVAKPAAKQAIEEALKAKEAEIDSRTDLTDEEKAAAKADAQAKSDEAKKNIDAATTNAEVDQAKSTGTTEVNSVNPQPVAKPAAKQAIDDALKTKESAIDSRTDLTDEEKAAAKADAKAKADKAKKNIDNATTDEAVSQAKTDGINSIASVNPTAQSKPSAKQAIDDALKAKEAAIDSRTDLTDEEKAAAKADAKAKADEAKKNIDAATTDEAVSKAKTAGTTEITSINPQAVAKSAAKQAIDDALKAKEAAIDSRTDLTDEEKAVAKADAKAKSDEAKKNIDAATTDAEVDQVKTDGITEVNGVNPQPVAKPVAKQAIEEALKAKEAEIDSRTDLTDEEKAAAKADAQAKSDEAKKNIDAATTNAEVDQAKSTGTTEVNAVNPQAVAKPAAKQAIDDALKTKEAAIDSRTDLTDEEKAAAKADAQAKADEAKKNIDAATTNAEVDQVKTDGITEVNGVNPQPVAKPVAKQAIEEALKAKEAAIDSRTDLTDEEKAIAKADAKAKADEAKKNIDTATTDEAVSQAKTDGITEVNGVELTAQSKPAAKQAIDEALKAKEAAIDSRTDLTDEEKAVAKADAKAKADEAKKNIDAATTDAEVDQAKSTGTTEVNSVNPQPVAKPAAKQAIEEALKAKEAEIDSRTDLTDEEKAAAKADAQAKSDEAKKNIDAATTNAEVDQAKSTGTTEVNSVNPQPVAKPAAKQAIDDALKTKESAIDSRTDLTDEEKAAAKADAKAKADKAKKNIDNATTDEAVSQAKTDGINSIASVNPTAQSKPSAKQAIDDALKTKEAAIDSRTDLTDEEKAAAKADAKAKADEAKRNIDTATTDEAVSQAKTAGTTEVNSVNPQAVSKPAAKQAIDDALKTKEASIDSRTDLTDEEKAVAKADAKAKSDEAKKNIDAATTNAEVDQAKSTGTTEVNSINPQPVAKPAAKQAIDEALKAKEAAIDSRTDLTDEEKAVAKADAQAKSDEAKKNIDAATTNAEVDQAKSTGTTEVNAVNPQAVAKPAAKQAIDDALKTKEAAIDSRTDLTDEEKAAAKADAQAKADEAKKNIDAATTDEAVSQAKTAGTTEVNGVNPTAQSKPAAKQAIDDALKAKEAAIDSRTDLTDEEKTAAKADAKAKADEAKRNIDTATTDEAVSQAKTAGTTSIASVNPTAQSKPAAKQAVEDTLKTKKLPNTGTAESLSTMVVAATSAILGLALLSHRRKEDDEV